MKNIKFLRPFSLIFILVIFYFCYIEYSKISYFYEKKFTECTVISKDIRVYNSSSSAHRLDLSYKNVFICQHESATFEVNVLNNTYYHTKIGDKIHLKLSLSDMFGDMPNIKFCFISCPQNTKFICLCILLLFSITFFVSIEIFNYENYEN